MQETPRRRVSLGLTPALAIASPGHFQPLGSPVPPLRLPDLLNSRLRPGLIRKQIVPQVARFLPQDALLRRRELPSAASWVSHRCLARPLAPCRHIVLTMSVSAATGSASHSTGWGRLLAIHSHTKPSLSPCGIPTAKSHDPFPYPYHRRIHHPTTTANITLPASLVAPGQHPSSTSPPQIFTLI